MLLIFKKLTDNLTEQTKTKRKETLEFNMNKQMQIFSINPAIILLDGSKRLLAVSFVECTNSVYIITSKNNSFSIIIPGHWGSKTAEKTIGELSNLLEYRSLEYLVKEVRKRGNQEK